MKHFRYISGMLLLAGTILAGCNKSDNYKGFPSEDDTKPGAVSNVRVVPFNGGAEISYDLPKSPNLLYVLAEYRINDQQTRQAKASYYDNKLIVEGFKDAKPYDVTLTVVTRSEAKSDPVKVTVTPKTPIYKLVRQEVKVQPDFGGIYVSALNPEKKSLGVIILAKDQYNDWEVIDQLFTTQDSIRIKVRGYPSVEREFRVFVTDKWNNLSDTLSVTLTPIFEKALDKTKFKQYQLPTDQRDDYGWIMPYLWDDRIAEPYGFHTPDGSNMPQHFTFDLGVEAKLSRFKIWPRTGSFVWSHGNPKRFRVWGSRAPNPDGSMDGTWELLGEYDCKKPSGSPLGTNTQDDISAAVAGFDYDFPSAAGKVRYIRFETLETMSEDFMHLMEMTIWGAE